MQGDPLYNSDIITDYNFLILKGNRSTHDKKLELYEPQIPAWNGLPDDDAPIPVPCSRIWLLLILITHTYTHTANRYGFSHLKEPTDTSKTDSHLIFETSLWDIHISLSACLDTEYQDKAHITLRSFCFLSYSICHKFLPFTCNMTSKKWYLRYWI